MKVRFAVAPGGLIFDATRFVELVEQLEAIGFDTLWLSDIPMGPSIDPVVGLGYAAAASKRLKLGANVVPFGRNPMILAKTLAQLDQLSGGRILLSLVPGIDQPNERLALGIGPRNRWKLIEEIIPLLRTWWSGEPVSRRLEGFVFDDVRVEPRPAQQPLEIWLGGNGPQALDRIGRLADGWLGAAVTPTEAGEACRTIQRVAHTAGRTVPLDHFGMSLGYGHTEPDVQMYASLRKRRPDVDPRELMPVGATELRDLVRRYVDNGVTKFVVRPNVAPESWEAELHHIADTLFDLQT
ncbi:MAG TPA: LLM class flavin-dependent oxidoreductase [Acidimicrobiales bacterium]|nr:LLM class flavin-dependent oxidoreductase [Acidimicrobiales bacterium]